MLLALVSLAHAWSGAVTRMDDGAYLDPAEFPETVDIAGNRTREVSVWVDAAIGNWDYSKSVYIYWTVDGWASWSRADAWYEGDLGGGYEQWGVDLAPLGTLTNDGAWSWFTGPDGVPMDIYGEELRFEYAIAVEMGGNTYWDNNGGANHSLVLHSPELAPQADGTAIDLTTGNRWLACPMNARTGAAVTTAGCTGATPAPWGTARMACENLVFAGEDNWYLPNTASLGSLSILAHQVPTLFEEAFPGSMNADRSVWTDTASTVNRRNAYVVTIGPNSPADGAGTPVSRTTNAWVYCMAAPR